MTETLRLSFTLRPWLRRILAIAAACLVAACSGNDEAGGAPAPVASAVPPPAAQPAPGGLPNATQMMNFIEVELFGLFPTHEPDRSLPQVTYRAYLSTRNFVGITADGGIYALGDVVNSATQPVRVSQLSSFPCDSVPGACADRFDHRITVAGQEREFIVWRSYKARTLVNPPVVFMLHGTSGTGEQFLRISGWREKADTEGLVVVFPQALVHCYFQDDDFDGRPEVHAFTKWAAGKLGDPAVRPLCTEAQLDTLPPGLRRQADHPLADDMAFFRQMVSLVQTTYKGDPKRTYVAGFSNGAEMSGRLAAEASDLFAAAHCGSSVVSSDVLASHPIPVIHSMGNLDPDQGRRMGYYDEKTQTLTPIPLDESLIQQPAYANGFVKPFLDVLQLKETYSWRQDRVNDKVISRFDFVNSKVAGRTNSHSAWMIEGLDHAYPNGKNHPIVMADVLWDLFAKESLP